LAINASLKKENGNCQEIIDNLFIGAQKSGAVCSSIRLVKMHIERCIACNYCQKQKDYTCIYNDKDDFISIVNQIRDSDIVILATPIYIFQISSLLKTFLERFYSLGKAEKILFTKTNLLFHDIDKQSFPKAFVPIIVSDNIEKPTPESAIKYFNVLGKMLDIRQVGLIIRNGEILLNSNDDIMKHKKIEINHLVQVAGQELVLKGSISRKIQKRIGQNILPIPKEVFDILKHFISAREEIIKRVHL
jgi:multimeric flavodoxin WrbA